MTSSVSGISLTLASRELRRCLGPMAWTVLEDLALDAVPDEAGVMVARTSARQVAEHLDMQPGTAAKALARLREEGLVSLVREAGPAGRFGLSVYRLAAIPGLTFTAGPAPCVDPPVMAPAYTGGPNVATPGWGWVRPDVAEDVADAHGKDGAAPPEARPAQGPTSQAGRTSSTMPPAATRGRPGRSRRTTRAAPVAGQQATLWDEPT